MLVLLPGAEQASITQLPGSGRSASGGKQLDLSCVRCVSGHSASGGPQIVLARLRHLQHEMAVLHKLGAHYGDVVGGEDEQVRHVAVHGVPEPVVLSAELQRRPRTKEGGTLASAAPACTAGGVSSLL
jgi:hypothetical protein